MGILADLMTLLWFNWNEDRKERKASSARERQINRLRAQLGYVSLEVEEELRARVEHDRDATIDYLAGTLDRDSQEWIATEARYHGAVTIDGRYYDAGSHLLYRIKNSL